ncbi:MAG: hypothetical protein WDN67_00490 [Candidatus Moraniibacteriota bacterium]
MQEEKMRDAHIALLREEDRAISEWTARQVHESITLETMPKSEDPDELPLLPPPPPPSLERMKGQGCVADGLLSGYGGDTAESVALINRSNCYYLHRALETWRKPPDFEEAREIKEKITKPNTLYGMFIAEALGTDEEYEFPPENREFNFNDMCGPGSDNFWGEHTCKPSLAREEYRKYVQYITEQAMDMGIQSFLFGQVFYQDDPDIQKSEMPKVIERMREYAAFRGMKIVIGAQTNDITDSQYLGLFDYIEGGVGLGEDGRVEDGACFSRWWKKPGDWCWALLWHDTYRSKAKNVLVHLDWSGRQGDDMSVFTRLSPEARSEALRRLQRYFRSQDVGFLMPLMATLPQSNGGCSGPSPGFYSASLVYGCADERVINNLLRNPL